MRRGQAWGFDLMMAISIFIIGIVVFYIYSLNYPKEGQENLDSLFYEGDFIGELLLAEGYPADWTESTVLRVGLTNNDKINETKLNRFYYLANYSSNPTGYAQAKSSFNTQYNFFVNFSTPLLINGSEQSGIGRNFVGQNTTNLLKVTRFTIYREEPVSLNIYIWE